MKDKKNVIIITAILVIVVSLLFLTVTVTANFIIAYIFALIGIAGLLLCTFTMLNKKGMYPWIAALPSAALTYLIIEIIVSAVVVVLEQLYVFALPFVWFIVIHVALLAIFSIRIVMLRGGAEHIEKTGEKVGPKVQHIKSLQADIELLISQTDDAALQAKIKALAEMVRYSDPMSAPELAPLEQQLAIKVGELKASLADPEKAAIVIGVAEQILEERNKKCKLLK